MIEALEKRDQTAALQSLSNDISRSFDLIRGRIDQDEAASKQVDNG